MGLLDSYFYTWQRHRERVHELRGEYEQRMEALERFRGSDGYMEDAGEAKAAFESGLDEIRSESRRVFGRILESMQGKIRALPMKAPSDDELRILSALQMRDSLSSDELESALESLRGCDLAVSVLRDLAAKAGKVLPPAYQSERQQLEAACDALQRAVANLMLWSGETRSEALRNALRERHEHRWGSGEAPSATRYRTVDVADVEAESVSGLMTEITGVDFAAIHQLND